MQDSKEPFHLLTRRRDSGKAARALQMAVGLRVGIT